MKKKYNQPRLGATLLQFDLKMKLTLLLLLTTLFGLHANDSYSQKTKITLEVKNATVSEVIDNIESKTKFNFVYNIKHVDLQRKLSLHFDKENISIVLKQLFSDTNTKYKVRGTQVVLWESLTGTVPKTSIPDHLPIKTLDVQYLITGTITDVQGAPLPGATIIEKGTTNGTQSDFNGKFTLDVADENSILVVSYIGFATKEIQISGQSTLSIALEESASSLEEVVVVGFGTQKRENITGAVSTIKMDDVLGGRPLTGAASAIQGTIPGLQITSGSGRPGTGVGLQIRGFESINGGSPLVLVNNVPQDLGSVNPNDIESITVLKDAAASSIYGARAAFGVILVTTKKGKRGQDPKISYSTITSLSKPTDLAKKVSPYDHWNSMYDWDGRESASQDILKNREYALDYLANPGKYPDGYAFEDGAYYPLRQYEDDFYAETGMSQIHNLSVSGGGDKSTYRIGLGYSDEDGIIVTDNDSFKKYTVNADYGVDFNPMLSASFNINYINSLTKDPFGDYNAYVTFDSFDPTGDRVYEDGSTVPYWSPGAYERLNVPQTTKRDNLRLFGKMEFKPTEFLTFTGEYTLGNSTMDRVNVANKYKTAHGYVGAINETHPSNTWYKKDTQRGVYKGANIYGSFKKSFGSHNVNFLAGFNNENQENESYWALARNLIDPNLPSLSLSTGDVTADDSFGEWSVMGYFGRLNYNYADKYFLEVSGRYDGSSRFAKNKRWGFFPSASVGWNIAKENFMQEVDNISLLKLRASYGEIGNQNVGSLYPAISGMPAGNSNWINPSTGLRYVKLGSPQLISENFSWESVRTLNFGLDFGIMKNRFTGSFDIFERQTIDMITQGVELSAILGARVPLQNAADLKTNGWELEMSWKDNIKDFSYYISLNLSDSQTEITKFGNVDGILGQHYVGEKIGELWGYVSDGYYTVDDFVEGSLSDKLENGTLKDGVVVPRGINPNPGDIKYKDLDGDGEINTGNNTLYAEYDEDGNMIPNTGPGDRKVIGDQTRRYQYGIRTGASYKNFDISLFIQGVGKRDRWISNAVFWPHHSDFSATFQHQLDYWTPENPDAYYPRVYMRGPNRGYSKQPQTKYLANGAYIRLKNITLGYNLPNTLLRSTFLDKVRVYVSGENLLNFDHLPDGLNAELNDQGQGATYPFLKQYTLGVNITF